MGSDVSGFLSLMVLNILIMQIIPFLLNSWLASSFLIIIWLSRKNSLEFGVCANSSILVFVTAFISPCLPMYWHFYLYISFLSFANMNIFIRNWALKTASTKIWFLSLKDWGPISECWQIHQGKVFMWNLLGSKLFSFSYSDLKTGVGLNFLRIFYKHISSVYLVNNYNTVRQNKTGSHYFSEVIW